MVSLSGINVFLHKCDSDTCLSYLQNNNNKKPQKNISCAKWMERCLVFSGHQVS